MYAHFQIGADRVFRPRFHGDIVSTFQRWGLDVVGQWVFNVPSLTLCSWAEQVTLMCLTPLMCELLGLPNI